MSKKIYLKLSSQGKTELDNSKFESRKKLALYFCGGFAFSYVVSLSSHILTRKYEQMHIKTLKQQRLQACIFLISFAPIIYQIYQEYKNDRMEKVKALLENNKNILDDPYK